MFLLSNLRSSKSLKEATRSLKVSLLSCGFLLMDELSRIRLAYFKVGVGLLWFLGSVAFRIPG